jgi:hypothetical protein
MRLFLHLLDMSCIVGWLLYKRASTDNGLPEKKQIYLFDFKLDVAESMCWSGKPSKRKSLDNVTEGSSRKRMLPSTPNVDTGKDKMDHWPAYADKTARCKSNKCQKITKVMCIKCDTCVLCQTETAFTIFIISEH